MDVAKDSDTGCTHKFLSKKGIVMHLIDVVKYSRSLILHNVRMVVFINSISICSHFNAVRAKNSTIAPCLIWYTPD